MIRLVVLVSNAAMADEVCAAGFSADPNFTVESETADVAPTPCLDPLRASAFGRFRAAGVPLCEAVAGR